MEGFGTRFRRIAFYATDAHQAVEGIRTKPGAPGLRRVVLLDQLDLLVRYRARERDEQVRRSEVFFVFGDLVFSD